MDGNNHLTTSGFSCDASGNVLADGINTYAWDVETRPTTIDSVGVTYDALGRMVEQNSSGSYTEIVYDPLGNKLALMSGTSTLKQAFVPLPAGATAVYNASGLHYYRHPDWLGSSRFSSTPSRTMYNDLAYSPFGEIYATSGTTTPTNISFAGNNEDTTTNLYDAYFREYGIQGRWPSPDPAGIATVNPANPQSWNRYAYVLNNPENLIDPAGLQGGQSPPVLEPAATPVEDEFDLLTLILNSMSASYDSLQVQVENPDYNSDYPGAAPQYLTVDVYLYPEGDPFLFLSMEDYGTLPQAPTPQQPQKKPCTVASRAASAIEGLDAAADASTAFSLAAGHFALAFVSVSGGCFADATPFEPLTCGAAVVAGGFLTAGGTVLGGAGVFFSERAYSAIKQSITCGPGK